jgi:hypothetical protein
MIDDVTDISSERVAVLQQLLFVPEVDGVLSAFQKWTES